MKSAKCIFKLFLAVGLLLSISVWGGQTGESGSSSSTNTGSQSARAKGAPSPQQIADAKAKGLVWVNTATRVYHKEGPSYGTTKRGKFLTEEEAKKAGFRLASETAGNTKAPKE